MKQVAIEIIQMEDGLFGSKKISATVGGCAMNTSRAAHKYLQATNGFEFQKVVTLGCVGDDEAGKFVAKSLDEENMMHEIYVDDTTLTGQCAVTVINVDRTCIAILDACTKYPFSHLQPLMTEEYLKDTICFYSTAFFIEGCYEALFAMA